MSESSDESEKTEFTVGKELRKVRQTSKMAISSTLKTDAILRKR